MSNVHSGFAKIHERFFTSSIQDLPIETRYVFIYLIASCGRDGHYDGNVGAISRLSNTLPSKTKRAMEQLSADDPTSTTQHPEHGGRRIVDVSGVGIRWLIVNHEKYRKQRDSQEVAEYNQRYYETKVKPGSSAAQAQLKQRQDQSSQFNEKQRAEAEGRGRGSKPPTTRRVVDETFDRFWGSYPRKVGKGAAQKSWGRLLATDRALALEAVAGFASAWKGASRDRVQFIPHPTTWINQRRWEDDPAEWASQAGGGSPEFSDCAANPKKYDPSKPRVVKEWE